MAKKKTEGGREFSSSAYLVVPDPDLPSTWKLRIEEEPGKVTPAQLGRAAAALGPGFRGNKVSLTKEERASALRKLRGLYKSHDVEDMPSVLQQAMADVATRRMKRNLKRLVVVDGGATAEGRPAVEWGELKEDSDVLHEGSLHLSGLTAVMDGDLSYEAVHDAVEKAVREASRQRAMVSTTGGPSISPECVVVATFPAAAIYCEDGQCFQVSYHMAGSTAVIEGEPVEVTAEFEPVGEDETTEQEALAEGATLVEAMPAGRLKQGRIDRERGVIEGTAIITNHSSNGTNHKRLYSDKALQQIAKMSEGLPAFANHVAPDQAFKPRDVRDIIGRHHNVRFVKGPDGVGRVMSDLHVVDHHQPWVFSLADRMGDMVGNSLVSKGTVKMEGDTEVVDDILQVRSADLVSDPASTRGLFESAGSPSFADFVAVDRAVFEVLAEAQHPTVAGLTFPKAQWPSRQAAQAWARAHGFQADELIEEAERYVLAQGPAALSPEATRTIVLTEAHDRPVQAVVIQEETVDITSILKDLKDTPEHIKVVTEHFGFVPKADAAKLQEAADSLTKERDALRTERDTLKVKVDGFEAKEAIAAKRAKLQEAIAAHDLGKKHGTDSKIVTPVFVTMLEGLDEAAWKTHLDERLALVQEAKPGTGRPRSAGKDAALTESRDGEAPSLEGLHQRLAAAVGR